MKNYMLTLSDNNAQYMTKRVMVDQNPWFGEPCPGVKYRFAFPNGYEASVVKFFGSYGWEDDQWEMAIVDDMGNVIYNEDFPDVKGWLSDAEVNEYLTMIANYPEVEKCKEFEDL